MYMQRKRKGCGLRLFLLLLFLVGLVLLLMEFVPSFASLLNRGVVMHGSAFGSGPALSFSLPGSGLSQAPVSVSSASMTSGTSILGRPSLSVSFIDSVLALAQSPAQGTGQTFYTESVQTGIDDAYPLAIFQHELSFGRAGAAVDTRNPGNINCAGFSSCLGRFRLYSTWAAGVQDLYQLLVKEYLPRHLTTLESILQVYAPTSDGNSPADYVAAVKSSVALWRKQMVQGVQS